jgi:hypothetical protein
MTRKKPTVTATRLRIEMDGYDLVVSYDHELICISNGDDGDMVSFESSDWEAIRDTIDKLVESM